MSRLTDTQMNVLSAASQGDDGALTLPQRLKGAAASRFATGLIGKGLVKEIRAKPRMPVWRKDDDGRSLSLVITRLGRKAIGDGSDAAEPAPSRRSRTLVIGGASSSTSPAANSGEGPRAGTKQALLIRMLTRKGGAVIDELIAATSWLPHTTRAALTGLRKRGYRIERSKNSQRQSVYRIAAADAA